MVCLLLLCSAGAACMQASLRGHGAEKGVDYYVTRMNLYNLIFRMVILIPFLTQPPHERTLTEFTSPPKRQHVANKIYVAIPRHPLPRLPATPKDIPGEIFVPLPWAVTKYTYADYGPPPPSPCPNTINQLQSRYYTRCTQSSSGNSIYEEDTVTNSPSPPPIP